MTPPSENTPDSKSTSLSPDESPKVKRKRRIFPTTPFQDSLEYARAMYKVDPTGKVRRLTLFDELGKSPDSGPSRMMVTNANKYGITSGGYAAEYIELTSVGIKCVDQDLEPVRVFSGESHNGVTR